MYCFECNTDTMGQMGKCADCGKPFVQDADRFFKAGMEALASGEISHAVSLFRDCISIGPVHVNGLYNLGTALALAGRYNEARDEYLAVLRHDPNYPGIHTSLGQVAFANYLYHKEQAEEQRQTMMELFETALAQDNEDIDAIFSLANAFLAVGAPEEALPCLKQALTIQPDSSAIYLTLAKTLAILRRYADAGTAARKAMQLAHPSDPFWEDITGLVTELKDLQTYT